MKKHSLTWYHVQEEFGIVETATPFKTAVSAYKYYKKQLASKDPELAKIYIEKHLVKNATIASKRQRQVVNPSFTWNGNEVKDYIYMLKTFKLA